MVWKTPEIVEIALGMEISAYACGKSAEQLLPRTTASRRRHARPASRPRHRLLGFGVSEPAPAWGLMLAGNAVDFYREAPRIVIFPGLAISVALFAFNLLGDSLRGWLDPRLRDVGITCRNTRRISA